MTKKEVADEYFKWLMQEACQNRYSRDISYQKLLMFLYKKPFTYSIPKDKNRASDGKNLRYRFACAHPNIKNAELHLFGPCSIFEMLLALAIRCEETIMDDPQFGDRTTQWFWGMITNLGLGSMTDDTFDKEKADLIINRFLVHNYQPNGKGGLFTVRHCNFDLRTVEIWHQMCLYLDSIG